MSVLQPFQFLRFTRDIRNQLRFMGCENLCDLPVIPQGHFVPFGINSESNIITKVTMYCHDEVIGQGEGPTIYYSEQRQATAIRNDCPAGQTGQAVTYTVPAGKYTSTISQADADNKAIADAYNNCQAYANEHGLCINTATYQMLVEENFDSWTGGLPDNWTIEETDYTTCANNSDRLDMTISAFPPVIHPENVNYPNMQRDTGIDFGIYSQLRIRVQVDSITGDHQFVLRYDIPGDGTAISYVRNLNNGLNEIILVKGFGYNDGYQTIGIKNYTTGQPYPKNIIIDYITVEGLP